MKFKLNSNNTYFEIDMWEFISNYNKVNTKIDEMCGNIKTKDKLNSCISKMTKLLESSSIKVTKKKNINSLSEVRINWKVISKKDWFYLTFSTVIDNKKYTYTIRLLSKLTFTTSWVLVWKKYSIEIEDLVSETLKSSINYWIKNPEITKVWLNISFKWLLIFWAIFSSFIYSLTQTFSYFNL